MLEVGRRLHARLSTLSGHLTRLGSALGTTMARFNETVGSYERSVLAAARRFDDLGIAESPVPDAAAAGGDGPRAAPGVGPPRRAPTARRDGARRERRDGTGRLIRRATRSRPGRRPRDATR